MKITNRDFNEEYTNVMLDEYLEVIISENNYDKYLEGKIKFTEPYNLEEQNFIFNLILNNNVYEIYVDMHCSSGMTIVDGMNCKVFCDLVDGILCVKDIQYFSVDEYDCKVLAAGARIRQECDAPIAMYWINGYFSNINMFNDKIIFDIITDECIIKNCIYSKNLFLKEMLKIKSRKAYNFLLSQNKEKTYVIDCEGWD